MRRGGRQNTTHLPSNTEKWGRAFDEVRGSATTTATSTAIGFEETERLLDESEWAVGSSAWRLEPREDEQPQLTSLERGEGLMAATNHGLLSLVSSTTLKYELFSVGPDVCGGLFFCRSSRCVSDVLFCFVVKTVLALPCAPSFRHEVETPL